MKTYMANPAKVEKKWYVVDAEGPIICNLCKFCTSCTFG